MDAISPFVTTERIDRALATLAATQHGVFSRTQAISLGATDSHLKNGVSRGRYRRVRRGVYVIAGMPESWRQRLLAACLRDEEDTFVSHSSAALIWGMPGIDGAPLELTTTADRRSRGGMRIHRVVAMAECDTTTVDAIPVTTGTRTLLDLGATLDEQSLEIALDDALRRRLTTVPRLNWRLQQLGGRGRAGTKTMKRLLGERTSGYAAPESPLETKVIRILRRAGIPPPIRQFHVRHEGREVARVDLAWPSQKVALEVDSYQYHSGRHHWERDMVRRNRLEAAGWKVIHVTAAQLAEGVEPL